MSQTTALQNLSIQKQAFIFLFQFDTYFLNLCQKTSLIHSLIAGPVQLVLQSSYRHDTLRYQPWHELLSLLHKHVFCQSREKKQGTNLLVMGLFFTPQYSSPRRLFVGTSTVTNMLNWQKTWIANLYRQQKDPREASSATYISTAARHFCTQNVMERVVWSYLPPSCCSIPLSKLSLSSWASTPFHLVEPVWSLEVKPGTTTISQASVPYRFLQLLFSIWATVHALIHVRRYLASSCTWFCLRRAAATIFKMSVTVQHAQFTCWNSFCKK